jgi:hypothetical protein
VTGPELVEQPQDEDAQPWGALEGAGVVSSWSDVAAARDPGRAAFALAGAGLDTLGVAMDPLGALGGAGVGYLIEHLWFLHEPLDALAGDPAQITAQSRTWQNVAAELAHLAAEYRGQVAVLDGWEGRARDAYARSAAAHADRLDAAGAQADELAALVLRTGVMVGTERALIRDLIADFLWWLIEWLVVWLFPAVVSAGAALAIGTTVAVVRALELAGDLARRVAHLLDAVQASAGAAAALATRFRGLADAAERAVPRVALRGLETTQRLEHAATVTRGAVTAARNATFAPAGSALHGAHDWLAARPTAEGVELGKQLFTTQAQQEEWERSRGDGA